MACFQIPERLYAEVLRGFGRSWLDACSRWTGSERDGDQHKLQGKREGLVELTNASLLSFAMVNETGGGLVLEECV
jgi:hypothetical protein